MSRMRDYIETKIESWLGLELNRDKTKEVNLRQPGAQFDFLGYTFRFDRDLHGRKRRYLNVTPSRRALKAERDRLRGMVNWHRSFVPITLLIKEVNRQLGGWSNYFSFGYPRAAKRAMNSYVRQRLTKHLRRRSQRPFRPPKGRSYYEQLHHFGLIYL